VQKAPSFPQFGTANIQMLNKNCYNCVKVVIQSTKLKIASFAKVSALKLQAYEVGAEIRERFLKIQEKTSR